jgi:hypothetical protein
MVALHSAGKFDYFVEMNTLLDITGGFYDE